MRSKLHYMTPAPGGAALDTSVRGIALQRDAPDGNTGAAQLPQGSALPADSLRGLPSQPDDALPPNVDLSKPILTQVLLVEELPESIQMAPARPV